jgi:hypothetical protein
VNGRAGTQDEGLADLDNRMFLNQIGVVSCSDGTCDTPSRFELEPPPSQPTPGSQLATPSRDQCDDQVLIVTAAASNKCSRGANTGRCSPARRKRPRGSPARPEQAHRSRPTC